MRAGGIRPPNPAQSHLTLPESPVSLSSCIFFPFFSLLLQIKEYEKLDSEEERQIRSRQIYDVYIMKELLSCSHVRIHLLVRHCVTCALHAGTHRAAVDLSQQPVDCVINNFKSKAESKSFLLCFYLVNIV